MDIIEKPMLEAFGLSDPGCVRGNNEDYFLVLKDRGLYLVADGMGGAQAGEHASKLAAETIADCIRDAESVDATGLTQAFEEANRRVMTASMNDSSLEGMGTTLLVALEKDDDVLIASVGDSRAYVYDENELLVVTEDQTWVHEVGRKLGIDETSLRTHPMRHVLTMAIGVSPEVRVLSYSLTPRPGALILLCSDGLHGVLASDAIAQVLSGNGDLESKCKRLIEGARKAGGPDNITAVLLKAKPQVPETES